MRLVLNPLEATLIYCAFRLSISWSVLFFPKAYRDFAVDPGECAGDLLQCREHALGAVCQMIVTLREGV